ncbi:hypothetical protein FHS23_000600 [Prauserella isguenensis]|uniref:Uncharacterized protein n=1 Tax=Prauserella isguenensis TaxID=1470180 RepID=A0A839RWQ9_9PSEU|nr:hypothetical protein [Prauserella isguenensis]
MSGTRVAAARLRGAWPSGRSVADLSVLAGT